MANFKFFIRMRSKNSTIVPVKAKIYYRKDLNIEASTPIEINPDHWCKKNQTLTTQAEDFTRIQVTKALAKIKYDVMEAYTVANLHGIPLTTQWLKQTIGRSMNRPNHESMNIYKPEDRYFLPFAKKWMEDSTPESREVAKVTSLVNKIKVALDCWEVFEEHRGSKVGFFDMTQELKLEFWNFLYSEDMLNYGERTARKKMSGLDKLYMRAKIDRPVSEGWMGVLKYPGKARKDNDLAYFTKDDIKKLKNVIGLTDRQQLIRDHMMIAVRTGFRVSDLKLLGMHSIEQGYLTHTSQKTKKEATLPIHNDVKVIIQRYNGFPPEIADPNFNEVIKDVARIAGIDDKMSGEKTQVEFNPILKRNVTRKIAGTYEKYQLITTHTGRRTLATLLYLDGWSFEEIMVVGGWSSVEMVRHYVQANKFDRKQIADKLQQQWEDEYKIKKLA